MSVAQSIGWCDETLNPIRGCTARCWSDEKHPEGNCYAAEIARRRMADCERCHDHLDVHFHEERVRQPSRWRKPRRIFLGSMTDLWDPHVKPEWRQKIWRVCVDTERHTYIALTKQPQRINWWELSHDLPEGRRRGRNLIVGVSVSGAADVGRVKTLREFHDSHERRICKIYAKLAVSFEPLLGELGDVDLEGIDWVIIGAASGAVARMHPPRRETLAPVIDEILRVTDVLSIPVFLKENAVPYLSKAVRTRAVAERYRRWAEVGDV